jgi:hypothetical protein
MELIRVLMATPSLDRRRIAGAFSQTQKTTLSGC